MNIGVNFFGPKRRLYHDFDGTLERLKAAGITSAEICVAFAGGGEPPKELKLQIPDEVLREMSGGIWPVEEAPRRLAAVREHGLEVVSVHAMLGFDCSPEQLSAMLPTLLEFGRANRVSYFVISLMKDLEGIRPYIPALRQLSAGLAQAGITLAYHNHEMECIPQDGVSALDFLLEQCPALKLELDVGWATFAGASPVALMKKYRARIPLLHFKDIKADACPANRDTCFTPVGEGSIPLADILKESVHCPLSHQGLIIDQDDSPNDILEDLALGAANIRRAAQ